MKKIILIFILFQVKLFSQTQGTILVISDKECTLSIDGGASENISANVPKKFNLQPGEHYLNAEVNVNSIKTAKSHIIAVEADKQKVAKFDFSTGVPEKSTATVVARPEIAVAPPLKDLVKINPKEVDRIKLVISKDFKQYSYKVDSLIGLSFELEESSIKKVVADVNMFKPVIDGELKFNSCGVILFYLKNGTCRLFYGNGRRFNEIIKGKITGEFYTMTAWNLIEKYWYFKKELLCEK
jgi:hypothetical protein